MVVISLGGEEQEARKRATPMKAAEVVFKGLAYRALVKTYVFPFSIFTCRVFP
jgi:hypothetical protein